MPSEQPREFRYVGLAPEHLEDGRVLSFQDTVEVDRFKHGSRLQHLKDEGLLVLVPKEND